MMLRMLFAVVFLAATPGFGASKAELMVARPPLDVLADSFGGWDALRAVRTFAYRCTIKNREGVVVRDARYRLDLETGQIHERDLLTGEENWWDGTDGWSRGRADAERNADVAKRLRSHAAHNFFRLLRDPATKANWLNHLYTGNVTQLRLRLVPAGEDAFECELDPQTGRIILLFFNGHSVGRERNYQPIGSLVWPMSFDSSAGPITGEFSELALLQEPALAEMSR